MADSSPEPILAGIALHINACPAGISASHGAGYVTSPDNTRVAHVPHTPDRQFDAADTPFASAKSSRLPSSGDHCASRCVRMKTTFDDRSGSPGTTGATVTAGTARSVRL